MIRFIFSRLVQGVIVIAAVVTITFLIMRLSPGDPFSKDRAMPENVRAELDRIYGFDKPLPVQAWRNLKSFFTLDLPPSYRLKGWSVGQIIAQAFPVLLTVGGAALLIAIMIGVPVGAIAALRAGQFEDRAAMTAATLGVCVPSFVSHLVTAFSSREKKNPSP